MRGVTDCRISVGLPTHPKTVKLIRRVGREGAWSLVCLMVFASANRPNGDLSSMSVEDVEIAADWQGAPGKFVDALCEVGFLDGEEDSLQIHDWAQHNPWAVGAEQRSKQASEAALVRHTRTRNAKAALAQATQAASSEHAESSQGACAQHADSMPTACAEHADPAKQQCPISNSNSISNTESNTNSTCATASRDADAKSKRIDGLSIESGDRFDRFWAVYPKKRSKGDAVKAWDKLKPDEPLLERMLTALDAARATPGWIKDDGQFIPYPASWLNAKGWEDEFGTASATGRPDFMRGAL